MNSVKISKFLSLVLRHKPDTIGLSLDKNGWADVQELIEKINQHHFSFNFTQLKNVVETSDKKRFAFSSDFKQIRANQGHSFSVDLELEAKQPPDILYHGTADRNLKSIKEQGLLKGQRHHVHLSTNTETANKVGMRYGKPVVLQIDSKKMSENGIKFYESENGVWLTDHVPSQYILFS
jgi:putative RNA 2'-phosphotransferase